MNATPRPPHHIQQSSRRQIQTHALRKASSMPLRRPYEMDPPAGPAFLRPPLPPHTTAPVSAVNKSPTRVQRSATVSKNMAPPSSKLKDEQWGIPWRATSYTNENISRPESVASTLSSSSSTSLACSSNGSGNEDVELLFSHPYSKIISFTVNGSTTSSDMQQELLPFTNPTDRTIAIGPLKLYRAKPHNIAFIQSGKILHPVMARSTCWCVKEEIGRGVWGRGRGRGVFVLRIRFGVFWRVELNEAGINGAVKELKSVLRSVLAFEKEECPFVRFDAVFVGVDEKEEEKERERRREEWEALKASMAQNVPVAPSAMLPPKGPILRKRPKALMLGPSREFPLHSPLLSPNVSPVLESFDDLLRSTMPQLDTCLNLKEYGSAAESDTRALEPQSCGSSPICISHTASSSVDSLTLSLSSSASTYATSTISYASSPLTTSQLPKPPSRAGSSVRKPSYCQPWVIPPPVCTTVTTTTTSETIFTSSWSDESETESLIPQPAKMLSAAAEMVIVKPSAYLVRAMLRIARSIGGGAKAGDSSAVECVEENTVAPELGEGEGGGETEEEDDFGFGLYVGSGVVIGG